MPLLLSAAAADGAGTPFAVRPSVPAAQFAPRLSGTVYAWGVFDGAAVTLEYSPDGETWFTTPALSFAAQGSASLEVYARAVRGAVSGAGDATAVTLRLLSPEVREE